LRDLLGQAASSGEEKREEEGRGEKRRDRLREKNKAWRERARFACADSTGCQCV